MNDEKRKTEKTDVLIILICSLAFAAIYIIFESSIMEYAQNQELNILYRFFPVLVVQFGMSCLGTSIVLVKNRELLSEYWLVRKNSLKSILGCLLFSLPTIIFLWYYKELHSFLPFQGMFLTSDILHSDFPFNVLLYIIVALVWGFGEGLFYVVFSDKLNGLAPPKKYGISGRLYVPYLQC